MAPLEPQIQAPPSPPTVAPPSPLFTVPIPALGPHPGGTVVCTRPEPRVYLITFTSPPDNRLTTASVDALVAALDELAYGSYDRGVLITTSGITKFYSNGLDLGHALATEGFLADKLYRLFARLLTFPMPTIALIPGHAFAGGFMLAMHHDYRVMNPSRGLLCVNELDFGVPLKPAMSAIFRAKLSPTAAGGRASHLYRSIVLEARRFGGREALDAGIVDAVGGLDEARALARERRLADKGRTGVYGVMRAEMYRECMALLTREAHEREEEAAKRAEQEDEQRAEQWRRQRKEWAKL